MKNNYAAMTLIALAVLAGCSSMPTNNSLLEQARNDYRNAQTNSQVSSLAPAELKQAGESLDRADHAWREHENSEVVDHLAYVAKQRIAIAEETARQKAAEQVVSNAGAERDRVRLDARTREAEAAKRNAASSQRQAELSQQDAEAARRQSEAALRESTTAQQQTAAAQRDSATAQQQAAAERQAAEAARVSADAARQQAESAQARASQLEAQLRDMEARNTDRGMVITLGDVLFDTNKANLKSGGLRNLQKLAEFCKQYPQRKVIVEGFTDSTGSASTNQELSDQRAQSVRTALIDMGVSPDRVSARGYGPAYPVAGNDTAAGRQLNRRVEVVISDDSGNIRPR